MSLPKRTEDTRADNSSSSSDDGGGSDGGGDGGDEAPERVPLRDSTTQRILGSFVGNLELPASVRAASPALDAVAELAGA